MGKNKNKPTPFGEFMKEYYFKHKARNGYKIIQDAYKDCKPLFDALTPEGKLPYEIKAKEEKERQKHDMSRKLDSKGRNLASVIQEQAEAAGRWKDMKEETGKIVKRAVEKGEFLTKEYAILHFNIYCHSIEAEKSNVVYYPAEVGLVKFSLKGFNPHLFHRMIDPGDIRVELRGKVHDKEQEHGIKCREKRYLDKDYKAILDEIDRAASRRDQDGFRILDPVFIGRDSYETVVGCFKFLADRGLAEGYRPPKILILEDLLYALRMNVHGYWISKGEVKDANLVTNSMIVEVLSHCQFDYLDGSACYFHEQEDKVNKCSLGFCRQKAMLIIQDMSRFVDVKLKDWEDYLAVFK